MTHAADLALFGLSHEPTTPELKTVFRHLATKHHPDLGGDREAFERVREAYNRLLAESKERDAKCPDCRGLGHINIVNGSSFFEMRQGCNSCGGTGKI